MIIVSFPLIKKMHGDLITIQETRALNLYSTAILGGNSAGCYAHGIGVHTEYQIILIIFSGKSKEEVSTKLEPKGCALAVNNHSWLALKG